MSKNDNSINLNARNDDFQATRSPTIFFSNRWFSDRDNLNRFRQEFSFITFAMKTLGVFNWQKKENKNT